MKDVIYILDYYSLAYWTDGAYIWKEKPIRPVPTPSPNCILFNPGWLIYPEDHNLPFIASLVAYFKGWDYALKLYI